MRDGLRKLLQSIEQQAEMQMPFEIGRLKLHVKRVRLDGFLRVLGLLVKKSKVISDFELRRTCPENLGQLIDGLGIFLLFPVQKRHSKLGVEVRRVLRQQIIQFLPGALIILRSHIEANQLVPDVPVSRVHTLEIFP